MGPRSVELPGLAGFAPFPPFSQVRGQYGRCLSVDYTNANAARQQDVILETCNGNAMQKWQYNGNGLLGHKGTGKCLSLENLGETGTQARVVSCDNLAPQLLAPTAVIGEVSAPCCSSLSRAALEGDGAQGGMSGAATLGGGGGGP